MSESAQSRVAGLSGGALRFVRRPRILLLLLAVWSFLAFLSEIFVNSGLFLDVHDIELDGALGGFALSFNALPLAVLYLYCWRDPARFQQVFWLAIVHQGAMAAGLIYHLALGTFSFESIVIPLIGSLALAVFAFLQVFEPRQAA
jgi:hypothetical protein